MAKITRAPTLNPVRPLKTAQPPRVSKTQDTYTHHTSPNKGPQPVAPEVNTISSRPKVKLRTLPDTPRYKVKHGADD